jgi:MFS family permease
MADSEDQSPPPAQPDDAAQPDVAGDVDSADDADGAARQPSTKLGPTLAVFLSVYLLGLFHRTSLGVAGLEARERFGISPFQLSVFVLLQLGVYAGMQIPAGILVDRFGSKRLLFSACILMAGSQGVFAVVHNYAGALLARGVLGIGDALVFVSVLRFAADHVTAKRYPLVVALTATMGSAGNVAATLPLTLLLHHVGWTPTFLGAAALSAIDAAAVWIIAPSNEARTKVRRTARQMASGMARVRHSIAHAWSVPATKLGFWIHFSCTCTVTFLSVLWGVPYLVQSQGLSQNAAASVLSLNVIVQVAATSLVGALIARRPGTRTPLALIVAASTVVAWALVLFVGRGATPDWLVILVFAYTALGGPASMVGFSIARDYNDRSVVGTATGTINVAGWTACVIASLLMGLMLSVLGTSRGDYRSGFLVALIVPTLGIVQILRWWRRTRQASLAALSRGERIPVHVNRRRWDLPIDDESPLTDRAL